MKITIVVPSGIRITIDADPEVTGCEIGEGLIGAGCFSCFQDDLRYCDISFKDRDRGRFDMERSLEANGVVENDILVIASASVDG